MGEIMMRPVIQVFFAAMLGLAVLFAPGPQSAQAAPVAPASLAVTPSDGSSLIQKTWYYYRRHHYYRPYYRHYYRPHYYRRHWHHRRHYW
jgi:hypothetical protein